MAGGVHCLQQPGCVLCSVYSNTDYFVLCLQQPGTPTQIVADIKEMIEEDSSAGGGGALLPFGSYKISRNGGFGTLKRLMSDKEVSSGCLNISAKYVYGCSS